MEVFVGEMDPVMLEPGIFQVEIGGVERMGGVKGLQIRIGFGITAEAFVIELFLGVEEMKDEFPIVVKGEFEEVAFGVL